MAGKLSAFFGAQDMTVGNPATNLIRFSTPLLIGNLAQQLYSTVDSIVVGNYVGDSALAAIGASGPIINLLLVLFMGVSVGASIMASQYFGAKDKKRLSHSVGTAITATFAVSIFIMVVGPLITHPIMSALQTPQDIYTMSCDYLIIIFLGILGSAYYNIISGILRGLGDSVMPLIFLLVACGMNIGLDIWFVAGFKMGVAGVAWATFLCQGVSCILAMVVIFRRLAKIEGKEKAPFFDWQILMQIVAIAIPSTLQQSFISLGNIVIQSIINGFGAPVMAGYSAAVKLNNLVITSFTTLGNGISNYTAQNLGARKMPRIREGFRAGVKMVWMLSLPLFLLYFFGGNIVLKLFMDEPTELAMHTGLTYLKILSPFYFVVSAKLVADGILRGAGLMKNFMAATFTDLILRVVLAFVFSKTVLGATGIWCAWPVGWCVATTLSILFYRRGPWITGKTEAHPVNVD